MTHLPTRRRSPDAFLRALGILCLACALLAPKLSLAVTTLLGEGSRSVVICTGTGLVRVTVSPDGKIIDDLTQAWVAPDCVLTGVDVTRLERAWGAVDYPRRTALEVEREPPLLPLPRRLGPAASGRDPPP